MLVRPTLPLLGCGPSARLCSPFGPALPLGHWPPRFLVHPEEEGPSSCISPGGGWGQASWVTVF